MRNYLIIVEGAHDIALFEKVLRINGVDRKITNENDLPDVWKHTIPSRYPFNGDTLDRITPIPSFLKNMFKLNTMFAEISCSGLESCFGLLFIWV